jgi:DNA-binding CsgD family transcriptional regulator
MKNALSKYLSKRDLIELLSIAHSSVSCIDREPLKQLVFRMTNLIPFTFICCAYGDIRNEISHETPDVDVLDISYPSDYVEYYLSNKYYMIDRPVARCLETLQPINWSRTPCESNKKKTYTSTVGADAYGMKDGWTYGIPYPESQDISVFFFGGDRYDSSLRTKRLIESAIPFLSETYRRTLKKSRIPVSIPKDRRKPLIVLTSREKEVLNWLKEGKSTWEISMILHRSERVVEFHIHNLLEKLNAVNRTHAVAIAIGKKIIEL